MPERKTAVLLALVALFTLVLLRTAWLTEDAYITFRVVDNFAGGYGLTWNPAERVQAYTHPLWMLVLLVPYLVTHEIFYTCVSLSIVVSVLTVVVLVFRVAVSATAGALAIVILSFSRAFVDFSTSGLENPLTHLILVLFFWIYLGRDGSVRTLALLSLLAALGTLNRMDTLLFFVPALVHVFAGLKGPRRLYAVALGFLPFVLWECFSLFYYGFFFPNTAYAKLSTGIPRSELFVQGFHYLTDSLLTDPLTLLTINAAIAAAFLTKQRRLVVVAAGILLYLLYVYWIGGDFMSGRFLSAPLCGAVVLLSRYTLEPVKVAVPAFALAVIVGFSSSHPTVLSGSDYGDWPREDKIDRGIADERAVYYGHAGLLGGKQDDRLRTYRLSQLGSGWAVNERRGRASGRVGAYVVVENAIGYAGFYAGPHVHILNPLALPDPLLARLPVAETPWRIGHFVREIPEGYVETLQQQRNLIADDRLAAYYDKLALVTRGPLFDRRRLVEIWKLNTGKYDDLVDFDRMAGR